MKEQIEILYVGNNVDFSLLVRNELEQGGFHLTLAENENQAWMVLLKEKTHLLLLDLSILEVNGCKFIWLVRNRNKNIPVIVYCRYAEIKRNIIAQAIEAGVVDFCYKDSDSQVLIVSLGCIYKRFYKEPQNFDTYQLSNTTSFNCRIGILFFYGVPLKMKRMDCCLLKLLCLKLNEWADPDYLSMGMWGVNYKSYDLRRYILRLRKLLSKDPTLAIDNQWGGFYRLKTNKC